MKALFCLFILAVALAAKAQGTVALQSYAANYGGYSLGTAGWSFQPLTNVSITALGCFEYVVTNQPGPLLVGLWAADGTLLASTTVTTNSTSISAARYEFIDPVLLSTNETYYLGAFATSGSMIVNAFVPIGPFDEPGYAVMAPEIEIGMAISSTNMSFEFPGMAIGPSDSAILAPNFQFQDGTVPPVLSIVPAGNNVLISWSATYTGYALQENCDLNTTNWTTTTNSVAAVGGQNQVLVTLPAGYNFYRLKSP
jgi:hypothetical protein